MTIAQSGGPRADSTARIRILGDPSPAPARASRIPFVVACVVVAIAGVGAALALRSITAANPGPTAAAQPRTQVAVGLGTGVAGPSQRAVTTGQDTFRDSGEWLSRLVANASEVTLPAAARYAHQTTAHKVPTRDAITPSTTPVRPVVAQAPAPPTVVPPVTARAPADNNATTVAPKAVGPELPPNPANPNSQIGSP